MRLNACSEVLAIKDMQEYTVCPETLRKVTYGIREMNKVQKLCDQALYVAIAYTYVSLMCNFRQIHVTACKINNPFLSHDQNRMTNFSRYVSDVMIKLTSLFKSTQSMVR